MMHHRRDVLKLGVAGAVAGLAGVARAQGTITARIGHLEAPTQPRHKGLEQVAALVKERTKGAVEFQLFPSSQDAGPAKHSQGPQMPPSHVFLALVQFGSVHEIVASSKQRPRVS